MEDLIEIRWHGRGGQGAVSAAKIFADAGLAEGKYVQAFPEYGPERMGAPVKAFNRLSSQPILQHSQIYHPRIVVVIDPTLLETVDVKEGLDAEGMLIINSAKSPAELKKALALDGQKVYAVDATKISLETIGRFLPNTSMLGALIKVSGLIGIEKIKEEIKKTFGTKVKMEIVEANIKAVERAYNEVKE